MTTFVRTQLNAIEPDLRQIIDRSETHEDLLLLPSPGQIKARLIPGRAKIIPMVRELLIPARWHSNGLRLLKAVDPARALATIFGVETEIPEPRKVLILTKTVCLWIKHQKFSILPSLCLIQID